MKELLKKVATAICGIVLALGVATPAFADTDYSKILTLNNLAAGDTVHVYKLMSYGDDYNTYEYDNTDDNGFKTYLEAKATAASKGTDDYLHSLTAVQVAELLDRFLYSEYSKPTPADYVVTGTSADVELEPGYYMFTVSTTVTESKMYKPFSAFVKVSGDSSTIIAGDMTQASSEKTATVSMKSEKGPTIDKKVKRNNGTDMDSTWKTTKTVTIGDEVTYRIAVTIPAWQNVYNAGLKLMDTLVNQQYVQGSVSIKTDEGDETTGYLPTGDCETGTIIEENIGVYTNGSQSLTFAIDYSKLQAGNTYYVTYKTKVMSDITGTANTGDMTATNTAKLQYNTGQSSTSTTTEKSTTLYTYAAELTKKDLDGKLLAGSGFTVYKDEDCTEAINFEKVTTDTGCYYRPSATGTVTEIMADSSESSLLIKGLDPYTDYYFKETTTPKGYYTPKGVFKLDLESQMSEADNTEHSGTLSRADSKITATNDADKNLIAGNVHNTYANQYDIVVKNSSTPSLPTTGGMGTALFTVAGVVLMAAAVAAFAVLRRRRQ